MPLDAFFKPNPDSDSRTPFGLNIFDLYKDLYEREFKFVPRHDRHVALFENGPSDDDAFTEAAFGGFPKSGALEPLAQAYVDAFDPEKLIPKAANWARVLKDGFRVPLHFTRRGIKRDPDGSHDPVVFVADPTSAPDLLDLWNIRQFYPFVLPVNLRWMAQSHDFLAEFIRANHRPLPGNPHGVMIHTTVQFGRSISEDRARVAVEEAGLTRLPDGSWFFKFGYDHIWEADRDDDYVWRLRRARVSAKSTDLELTVSVEGGESSVRFPTLSPDFADVREWESLLARRGNGRFARGLNLDPFVKANILKLGIFMQCPNCMKNNWYGVSSLKEQLICERCLKSFDFPQGSLDFRHTPWQYRVVGPFSVPNYAGGAYATILALRVFARNLGMGSGDTKLTHATGLNFGLENEKPCPVRSMSLACFHAAFSSATCESA
jgi:hypothetical protein